MATFNRGKSSRPLLSLLVLALLASGSPAWEQAAPPAERAVKPPTLSPVELEAASGLKTQTIRDVTVKLAAPEMEGRGTAQPGGDRAANYIADRFEKVGLKPKGDDNTYLQAIGFRVQTALPESSFKAGDVTFKFKDEFVVEEPFPPEATDISANLVFVAYGALSSVRKRDDLEGLDLKGKIVVLLEGKPKDVADAVWQKTRAARGSIGYLWQRGVAGFVIVHDPSSYGGERPFSLAAAYATRRRVGLQRGPGPKFLPSVLISPDAAEKLFAGSGIGYGEAKKRAEAGEFVSRDLGKQASISVRVKLEEGTGSNVIGVVDGSDATLKDEAVVYTAHYDAYGIDRDGTIFPGAADNALGVGKLIATAEVFARMRPRPRRSIIFIALTGEEYGKLGAVHWLRHPTWPLERVAANINYDGIGTEVWGKLAQITDVGFGHSELGSLIAEVADASNLTIVPDLPGEETMYRVDSYEFLKRGIPALFLMGGPQGDHSERRRKWDTTDYHMATDTVRPDWEWSGACALGIVGVVVGMRIANSDAMPAWLVSSPYNRPRGTQLPPPPR